MRRLSRLLRRARQTLTARRDLTELERIYLRRATDVYSYLRVNGLSTGRDIIALAASRARHRAAELPSAVRKAPRGRAFHRQFDREALLQFATLLADQPADEADAATAAELLTVMAEKIGTRAVGKEARFRLLELMVHGGRTSDLPSLLEEFHIQRDDFAQQYLLRANAVNPFRSTGAQESWLAVVNDMFKADGLSGIRIAPGPEAAFDRLVGDPVTRAAGGPLVTVIIPTHDPGPRLGTAVESLLAQSHRRLQILIVDDGSSAQAAGALAGWASRDARIEVIHLPENNGPYLARNIAVSQYAIGEYITVLDDDDWAHPRQIELQLAHLRALPDVPANMASSVRASDDLWFGRINGNPVWTQHALSSLMVRRSAFDVIGYWDVLNRSADAEFNDRIRAWTGTSIPVVGRAPLRFYRVRWDSLSAGEFNRGFMDSRRRWYYQSYTRWHEDTIAAGRIPALPVDDRASRPFSVPVDLVRQRRASDEAVEHVDVALVGDFREGGPAAEWWQVHPPEALGVTVGLLQLDSPALPAVRRVHPRVLQGASSPSVRVMGPPDRVAARLAVVLDPTVLQFRDRRTARFNAERCLIVDLPRPGTESRALYVTEDVAAHGADVFGCQAEWVDATEFSLRALSEWIPGPGN